jgi:hypothetical protein
MTKGDIIALETKLCAQLDRVVQRLDMLIAK